MRVDEEVDERLRDIRVSMSGVEVRFVSSVEDLSGGESFLRTCRVWLDIHMRMSC